ncbi:hypothetical protein [uncultured Kocuria sp.]|uniref:hypothetical protein n=1 Tax=uncultured Kocuria sp. TaxID=259305 RepID=UPI0026219D0B|nr:hypothetical protein [uncultured Kocuria sp.]
MAAELINSLNYSTTPTEELEAKGRYWLREYEAYRLDADATKTVGMILDRLSAEVSYRQRILRNAEVPDCVPVEWLEGNM